MKTVGIIGGMGPETTAKFYLDLIFKCYKVNKEKRPPILIWNVPLKYKIEQDFIEKGTGKDKYLPYLTKAAQSLEKGGADFLVIPCNTVHVMINEVRKSVGIPVLSIVEETENFLRDKKFKKFGILATALLLRRKLYNESLEKSRFKIVEPSAKDQERLGKIIRKIVITEHADREKSELIKIIWNLTKSGSDAIILACTDLQLVIKQKDIPVPIFDTMDILVDATVREILK